MKLIPAFARLLPVLAPLASPAPLPEPTAMSIAAILTGLPACAAAAMNNMISRAADFGCDILDVACLCTSKPFKKAAKNLVAAACPSPADILSSRQWATDRCTAALAGAASASPSNAGALKVALSIDPAASSKVATGIGTALPGSLHLSSVYASSPGPSSAALTGAASSPNHFSASTLPSPPSSSSDVTTPPLNVALFDLDDDEDWTSSASPSRRVRLTFGGAKGERRDQVWWFVFFVWTTYHYVQNPGMFVWLCNMLANWVLITIRRRKEAGIEVYEQAQVWLHLHRELLEQTEHRGQLALDELRQAHMDQEDEEAVEIELARRRLIAVLDEFQEASDRLDVSIEALERVTDWLEEELRDMIRIREWWDMKWTMLEQVYWYLRETEEERERLGDWRWM